jgi:hypothetical protein
VQHGDLYSNGSIIIWAPSHLTESLSYQSQYPDDDQIGRNDIV